MCPDNLLGNGKTQTSTTAIGRTRRIQAIELLKDHLELSSRDRIALIDKAHAHAAIARCLASIVIIEPS